MTVKHKNKSEPKFLGLDLSTQSLTAIICGLRKKDTQRFSVIFDKQFPNYNTKGGVLQNKDPSIVHASPIMWMEALEYILQKIKKTGAVKKIRAISVSAQQHGTVYFNQKVRLVLKNLDPSKSFLDQMSKVFSRQTSPVWMDLSTSSECYEITEQLGDDLCVAELTGSVATERFAGPQIRKFYKESPTRYHQTEHILFISSFLTSLLTGKIEAVDSGDGFGSNLANVRTCKWNPKALSAVAPNLYRKLPQIVCGDQQVGFVSQYLVDRYGFRADAIVNVGSGDNPNSIVGLGMIGKNSINAISLGTSDTYFGYMASLPIIRRTEGHIFGAADGKYMFLVCHKNGSLTREHIKNSYGLTWRQFAEILNTTSPGNSGKIMLPFLTPEITPHVPKPGIHRFGGLEINDPSDNVRGVVEGQLMSMYIHSAWIGKRPNEIIITAGGSKNSGILKLISMIFNVTVRTFEIEDSAALGAAIRAAYLWLRMKNKDISWQKLFIEIIGKRITKTIRPTQSETNVYHGQSGLINLYRYCENHVVNGNNLSKTEFENFRKRYG